MIEHPADAEFGTCYLGRALLPAQRSETIANAAKLAREILRKVDLSCVIVTGWSGALIGIPLADKLGLPITMVRKTSDREAHHSSYEIEGYVKRGTSGLFVDDCFSTGATIEHAAQRLRGRVKIGGVLLYAQDWEKIARETCQRREIFRFPMVIERYNMLGVYDGSQGR